MKPATRSPFSSNRGSVLLVAMILGIGIAMAIGGFLTLTMNAAKLSHRSYHSNSCLNLAEAGLEEAIYALNSGSWGTGWANHSSGSNNKVMTRTGFDLGQGNTGSFTVVVFGATSSPTPRIVAEGRTNTTVGSPVTKQLEVIVSRKSKFASGLVARDTITFSGGNVTVDAYNSSDPNYSTGGLYDPNKKKDTGTAGSVSVETSAVDISNSHVWGFVATGGGAPNVGPNGTIKGQDTPEGVKVDTNRIATDFTANFDNVTGVPTSFDADIGNLVGNTDHTIGTTGTSTVLRAGNINNNNNNTITVNGDVTLVVTNGMTIKGDMVISSGSSLTLYLDGDMDVGGNGIANTDGLPEKFLIYGIDTREGGQTIKLHGNGAVHAAIYAPNANVDLKGGGNSGEFAGSIVANSIKMTGNYAFHYDEALRDVAGGNPFSVGRWRELVTAADRVALH